MFQLCGAEKASVFAFCFSLMVACYVSSITGWPLASATDIHPESPFWPPSITHSGIAWFQLFGLSSPFQRSTLHGRLTTSSLGVPFCYFLRFRNFRRSSRGSGNWCGHMMSPLYTWLWCWHGSQCPLRALVVLVDVSSKLGSWRWHTAH